MTADKIKGYFEYVMSSLGFFYTWEKDFAVMTSGAGGVRWKTAVKCLEDGLAFYSSYPWRIKGYEERLKSIEYINKLNSESGFGCYFLLELFREAGYIIVYRRGVLIPDEYSAMECIENGLKNFCSEFYSEWTGIFRLLNI